ncbi:AsmA family protein [Roseateles amylovorans]|uniref:AsmA family protein n=1 Tax=Roseateles amylovorans TaxID=2978473 RepID=A0ABY6AUB2_9BURK|nr:AsmA family protein [Roseateles amylovorans]UXH76262.1 AsmA family protein [Roseateles amylovorans]
MNSPPPTPLPAATPASPPSPDSRPPSRPHTRALRRWGTGVAAVLALLVGTVLVCEWMGWPFLRRPMENWLSQKLDRMVSFDGSGSTRWQLRLIGGLRLETDSLQISGPSWSTLGPMLVVEDAKLALRYGDLLALRQGEALRVKSLSANDLTLRVERDVEGRASWQFGRQPDSDTQIRKRPNVDGVRFDLLEVRKGTALIDDKIQRLALIARFALREDWETGSIGRAGADSAPLSGTAIAQRLNIDIGEAAKSPAASGKQVAAAGSKGAASASSGASAPQGQRPAAAVAVAAAGSGASAPASATDIVARNGMIIEAEGNFRNLPLKASLRTGSALPWLSSDPKAPSVPVTLRGGLGRAKVSFDGEVRDLLVSQGLNGRFEVAGPSLAAIGEPLGVTLPTTPPFAMNGTLSRDGWRWRTSVASATIGKSKLNGDFEFTAPPNEKSKLTGQLRGRELWMADLGPSIGLPTADETTKPRHAGRVLPDRNFDLPSLRAMDADVTVRLDRFESGTALLQAAQPLSGHIVLKDGVLEIRDIDARVAKGQFAGRILLDGRQPQARWEVRLRVNGVQLEQWLKLQRKPGQPPYVTGVMGGRIALDGRGRSTAELLASADGRMVLFWTQGSVSHLIVEAAGIDVAQALGVLIKGDDGLPVSCGVADLRVRQGRVTPQPMLIDTRDSLVRVEGDISLATERLMLTANVQPKDVSPLTLRTPLKLQGTLSDPNVSLEKTPLLKKLVPAAVLGVAVAPLAALLPLVDLGEEPDEQSRQALSECNATLRGRAKASSGS